MIDELEAFEESSLALGILSATTNAAGFAQPAQLKRDHRGQVAFIIGG
jgi:hypothetical protein